MSETTTPTTPESDTGTTEDAPSSFPVRLLYAVYGAMQADLGCIIGAIAFFALIIGSAVFAAQLTPCTSAGGIPCAP
ncbi:MAG: hypothetical protein WAT58_05760 [Candidatus Dormiibacterota bacterium]